MIRSEKSRVMLLVANVMQQVKDLLKLIVVLLGLRVQKALFTPANYCHFNIYYFTKKHFFSKTSFDMLNRLHLRYTGSYVTTRVRQA
jgi:hypothetical protein